jgi:hypothetical protein
MEVHFRWREYGLVAPPRPDRHGFGSNTIKSSPYLFGGSATLDFHDGVECIIRVALPSAELSTVAERQA